MVAFACTQLTRPGGRKAGLAQPGAEPLCTRTRIRRVDASDPLRCIRVCCTCVIGCRQRGIILPFAVSDREGVVPFYVSPRDGCSSLRRSHKPARGGWKSNGTRGDHECHSHSSPCSPFAPHGGASLTRTPSGFVRNSCAKTVETRLVPAVSLRTVLLDWLPGWQVSRLKIDAQARAAPLLKIDARVLCASVHVTCTRMRAWAWAWA